eukprot:symbB.v1.2.013867.t1/scaffold991.1/size149480/2
MCVTLLQIHPKAVFHLQAKKEDKLKVKRSSTGNRPRNPKTEKKVQEQMLLTDQVISYLKSRVVLLEQKLLTHGISLPEEMLKDFNGISRREKRAVLPFDQVFKALKTLSKGRTGPGRVAMNHWNSLFHRWLESQELRLDLSHFTQIDETSGYADNTVQLATPTVQPLQPVYQEHVGTMTGRNICFFSFNSLLRVLLQKRSGSMQETGFFAFLKKSAKEYAKAVIEVKKEEKLKVKRSSTGHCPRKKTEKKAKEYAKAVIEVKKEEKLKVKRSSTGNRPRNPKTEKKVQEQMLLTDQVISYLKSRVVLLEQKLNAKNQEITKVRKEKEELNSSEPWR